MDAIEEKTRENENKEQIDTQEVSMDKKSELPNALSVFDLKEQAKILKALDNIFTINTKDKEEFKLERPLTLDKPQISGLMPLNKEALKIIEPIRSRGSNEPTIIYKEEVRLDIGLLIDYLKIFKASGNYILLKVAKDRPICLENHYFRGYIAPRINEND